MELEILAFIASSIGVSSCFPQILKILKTNDTEAISYTKYVMGVIAGILWVAYGLYAPLYSIVFWNTISTCFSLAVIILKFKNEYQGDLKVTSFTPKTFP